MSGSSPRRLTRGSTLDADCGRAALKELLYARVPSAHDLEAFEREARVLAGLDHPRIPKVLESFTEGRGVHTRLYLAQQFVDGRTLAEEVSTGPLDEGAVREVPPQVLAILEHLHDRDPPIVHRDVKPANVMRSPEGALVLVDFGAARDLTQGETHRATLVGTFGYMPLEQLGGSVDPTVDLYALGNTLLHLLTGRAPADLLEDGPELDLRPHLGSTLPFTDFVATLAAPRRTDRFPTAGAALDALERLPSVDGTPPREGSALPRAVRSDVCVSCGKRGTGGSTCLVCGASLRPGGLVPLRLLSHGDGRGRTYLARRADGGRVIVREHLLRPEADPQAVRAHPRPHQGVAGRAHAGGGKGLLGQRRGAAGRQDSTPGIGSRLAIASA